MKIEHSHGKENRQSGGVPGSGVELGAVRSGGSEEGETKQEKTYPLGEKSMRNRLTRWSLALVLGSAAASAFAVEDGLGTNHVRNLRAIEDAIVEGGDVTVGKGDTAKAGTIVLHDADAGDSNTITLQGNADVGTSYTLTLPGDDGDANQVLTTDGSGALSWTAPSANAASKALDNLSAVAINADLDPGSDNTIDLGDAAHSFKDLWIDGTANLPTVDIDAGDIDGVAIGANAVATEVNVDNLKLDGNALTSTDVNGNIALTPNGTGEVDITKVDIDSGAIDGVAIGANAVATEAAIDNIKIDGNAITSTDADGNIELTPDGTGEVDITKVDIDSGAIDGTVIGANSAAAASVTTLDATGAATLNGNVDLGDGIADVISFNGKAGTDLSMDNSYKVINLAAPSADSDAATKGYVDTVAAGLKWKPSVKAATTENGTLATAFANGATIDGISLSTGDRILIKDQSTGAENGIYEVQASGAPVRVTDFDANGEIPAAAVFVEEGTQNESTGWVCSNDDAVNIGVTALTFVQFTGAGTYAAGDGLDLSGTTFSVVASELVGTGLSESGNNLVVDDTAVAMLTGDQTVAGIKTFSSFPVSPSAAPTTDYQLANKKYVDDEITGLIASGTTASSLLRWDDGTSAWKEETATTIDASGNFATTAGLDVDGATTLDQVSIDTTDGNLAVTGGGTVDIDVAADIADTLTLSKGSGNALVIAAGGTADLNGDLDVAGNTILGDASSDTITFTAKAATDLEMDNNIVTGLKSPTEDDDAANKGYVDNAIAGLKWKPSVKAATTAAGTLASDFANNGTVDGITLATGDRVLIKNQTDASENGIYEVQASGAPTRVTDFDAGSEVSASAVFVEQGTINGDTGWVCSNNGEPVIDTDNITFVQFSAAGVYTAGDGITLAGTQFSAKPVDFTGTGLEVDSGDIRIAASAAGDGLTGGAGSALAVDSTVVRTTGDQTVAGIKTFSSFPVTPSSAPSADYETANKKYVDDLLSSSVSDGTGVGQTLYWDGAAWTNNGNFTVTAAGNTTAAGTLDVTGAVSLNDTTTSSSKDTGALVVEGGVGVEENLNVGGTLDVDGAVTMDDTTGSTSKDTGALIVDGGVGVEENIYAGGNLDVTGTAAVGGDVTLGDAAADTVTVNGAAVFESKVLRSPGSVQDIEAAVGVTTAMQATSYIKVRGSGGHVDITANPQIALGTAGQIITLQGSSDTQTVKLEDGNGLKLSMSIPFTLKNGDMIQLIYDGSDWREMFRQDLEP